MKRVLLTTALLATTLGAAAKFDGGYVSANVGYAWTQAKFQSTPTATKRGYNQSGVATFLKAGYGEHCGSVYVGGEVKGGYVFSNKKNGTDKLTRKWNGGIAARIGGCIEHNVLGYFRLGLDYDTYTYKYSGGSSSKNVNTWSITPGIGVDWKVAHNTFVTAGIDYGFAFKVSKPSGTVVNTKPKTFTVLVGAGYQF